MTTVPCHLKGDKVAVFGRMAFHYYKSGLGSGGLVNTRYVVSILDALRACKDIKLDEKLLGMYETWIKEHPYDEEQAGAGSVVTGRNAGDRGDAKCRIGG